MKTHKNTKNEAARRKEIETLVYSLASKTGMVRQQAREKLADIGTPAVQALIEALDDRSEQVRWEAAKTLVAIADHRAAPALVARLLDEDFDVRWLAAEALIALQEEALPALLGELVLQADNIQLREGAHHVLKDMKEKQVASIVRPVLDALSNYDPELTVPVAAKAAIAALQRQRDETNH